MTIPRRRAASSGQASVELLGVVALALLVAVAMGQLLAAGAARELAGNAAEAGATALLQRADATDAARAALPGWSRGRASISVSGHRVVVRLRPQAILPILAARLEASASADAGPAT